MWNEAEKKPVGKYIALTFLIAWGCDAVLILGERLGLLTGDVGRAVTSLVISCGVGFAPAIALVILMKKYGQIQGAKGFFGRVFATPKVLQTVVITALFFAVQVVPNLLSNRYLGNPWYLFILYMPLMLVVGGIEEIGWRGFFQPALEEKLPFPVAAALAGVVWAVWHLPLWFIQNAAQAAMNFPAFMCHCVALAFVLAALYKLTKSVFACVALHAWTNVLSGMFTMDTLTSPPDAKLLAFYAVEIAAAVLIGVFVGRKSIANAE